MRAQSISTAVGVQLELHAGREGLQNIGTKELV